MKPLIILILNLLLLRSGYSQSNARSPVDSISDKVIQFFQSKQPDSIYVMTGAKFKEAIGKEDFRNLTLNQILTANDFRNVKFVNNKAGVNKYKVSGTPELQLLVGLDAEKKIETLLVQLYAEDAPLESTPAFITDSLDAYVKRALAEWQIPGVAVGIIKDGRVVLLKGYGSTQIEGGTAIDENTLFMIGSNTKAFTATAIAMLDAEKKLSLTDKVIKWIPNFTLENKAAGQQAIITDLLCHRLGFMTFQGDFTYWTSNLSRNEVIQKMGHIKAAYPFRTTWGYTNAAFVVAGQIIPAVTGLQWEDFLAQKVFKPLGMSRTLALSKDYPMATNKAQPHTIVDGKLIKVPYCMIDNLAPAGSISSSVNDMSKWVMMQLENGMYDGKQVVPASAIRQTQSPKSIIGNGGSMYNKGHFSLYGLGWSLEEYNNRKIVSHTGGVNGFVTSVTLIPENQLGVIVFTNTDQNDFYEALKWEIVDAYLKLPYRNYSTVLKKGQSSQQLETTKANEKYSDSVSMHLKPTLPLSAYTGNFFNDVYGDMTVLLEKDSLKMKFSHHPDMYVKLEPIGGNRFYASFTDPIFGKAVFPFSVVNKKVKSVSVKVADFIEYYPYVFVKKN